jgi:hypothetical protein
MGACRWFGEDGPRSGGLARRYTVCVLASMTVCAALGVSACRGEDKGRTKTGTAASEESAPSGEVHAVNVKNAPLEDPNAAEWKTAKPASVGLLPQTVTYPSLGKQTVRTLEVRALADESWLAVRLSWEDATQNERLEVNSFTDAAAIQFPLGDAEKTNPMMGSPENPVYICHWKAVWQRDVDRGRADVQDLHPGYWADPYPFVTTSHPYDVQETFQTASARRYFAGTAAGNPHSKIYRRWPVEELHAEGFGSLAAHRMQDARGKGAYKDGRWTVVLAVPRRVSDPSNPRFRPGTTKKIGFAVWNGDNQDVGGRKMWAPFISLVMP